MGRKIFYKERWWNRVNDTRINCEAYRKIMEAELEERLMVFHLKRKWWYRIYWGEKDREYRGDKWGIYIERFIRKMKEGKRIYIELDWGYPAKFNLAYKMYFEVTDIIKEISKEHLGGDGAEKWAIYFDPELRIL